MSPLVPVATIDPLIGLTRRSRGRTCHLHRLATRRSLSRCTRPDRPRQRILIYSPVAAGIGRAAKLITPKGPVVIENAEIVPDPVALSVWV